MNSQDKRVVNTEEQNRTVNPAGNNTIEDNSLTEQTIRTNNDNPAETEGSDEFQTKEPEKRGEA